MYVIQAMKTRKKIFTKVLNNRAANNKLSSTYHVLPRKNICALH